MQYHLPTSGFPFKRHRSGRLNPLWMMSAGTIALSGILILLLRHGAPTENPIQPKVSLYCAAGMRAAVEEIAAQFEQETGIRIVIQYGGSNSLLNQLQINKFSEADLFLAADEFYTSKATELNLARESLPIAYQSPVIAVPRDNPRQIHTLSDLLQPGISIAVGNPDQAAIGRAIREQLEQISTNGTSLWVHLEERVRAAGVFKPTVTEIANDVKIGAVDAALVWNSTVAMPNYRDELVAISVPELAPVQKLISISILNAARNPIDAMSFARYLTARNRGLPVFEKYGTETVAGPLWIIEEDGAP